MPRSTASQPDPEAFARDLARYAQGDLTCYRADSPRKLAERQEQGWDPLLAWARRRYDVDFRTTTGVIHVEQPAGDRRAAGACGGGAGPVPAGGAVAAGDDRRFARYRARPARACGYARSMRGTR